MVLYIIQQRKGLLQRAWSTVYKASGRLSGKTFTFKHALIKLWVVYITMYRIIITTLKCLSGFELTTNWTVLYDMSKLKIDVLAIVSKSEFFYKFAHFFKLLFCINGASFIVLLLWYVIFLYLGILNILGLIRCRVYGGVQCAPPQRHA